MASLIARFSNHNTRKKNHRQRFSELDG